MLKLKVDGACARVRVKFWAEGSVSQETVKVSCTGVDAHLEIDSGEDREKIAKLARLSEAGCFVIQSLRNPTPVSYQVTLNGEEIDPQSR